MSELVRGIFNGRKFFVGRIVPQRKDYLRKIEENGGQTVRKEDDADLLIGDHMKKHQSPSGSVSFKFIDDSIQNGTEQDPNKYLVAEPRGEVRAVGASKPAKTSRRHPFTAEEDKFCFAFAKQMLANKGKPKGNAGWRSVDQLGHHGWQAWRSRYIEHLLKKTPIGWESVNISEYLANNGVLKPDPNDVPTSTALASSGTTLTSSTAQTKTPSRRLPSPSTKSQPYQSSPQLQESTISRSEHRKAPSQQDRPQEIVTPSRYPAKTSKGRSKMATPNHNQFQPGLSSTNKREHSYLDDGAATPVPTKRPRQANKPEDSDELDLSIPPPPGGFERAEHGAKSKKDQKELLAWWDTVAAEGFDHHMIADAVYVSTGHLPLAKVALDYLAAGKPLPVEVAGLWTEEDDNVLSGTDQRRLHALLEKHGDSGPSGINARWEFLECQRKPGKS